MKILKILFVGILVVALTTGLTYAASKGIVSNPQLLHMIKMSSV